MGTSKYIIGVDPASEGSSSSSVSISVDKLNDVQRYIIHEAPIYKEDTYQESITKNKIKCIELIGELLKNNKIKL